MTDCTPAVGGRLSPVAHVSSVGVTPPPPTPARGCSLKTVTQCCISFVPHCLMGPPMIRAYITYLLRNAGTLSAYLHDITNE